MQISIKKPPSATVHIQENQKVDLSTPYYEKNATDAVKIPLASILRFPPKKIFMVLHKLVGETVHKGDVIADYKGLFGIREYISEHTGTIAEINHTEGSITIHVHSPETNTVPCFFVGEVTEITGDIITIKVKTAKEYPVERVTHYWGGPVFYYNDQSKNTITEETVLGTVVVAESIPSYDQVKLEALGARTFITLLELTDKTSLPTGRISRKPDYTDIAKNAHPYCIVGPDSTSVFFYT